MLLQRRWMGPGTDSQVDVAPPSAHSSVRGKCGLTSDGDKKGSKKRDQSKLESGGEVEASAPPSKKKKQKLQAPDDAGEEEEAPDASDDKVKERTSADKVRARRKRQKRRRAARESFQSKDPELAAEYLRLWSVREQAGAEKGTWRFNKATQAWLIRHAYEPERVPKDVFRLLLRYVEGLQGAARDRMRTEADTIVTLGGAPLVEKEPEMVGKKRGKKSKTASDAAAPQEDEGAAAQDDADANAGSGDGADDAADLKQRKMRLLRAKKVLKVVGESS